MVNSNLSKEDLEKLVADVNLFYQRNKLNVSLPYYPEIKAREPEKDNIFEANDYFFGNNLGEGIIFGVTFTYSGRIVVLDSLKGRDRDIVLEHEKHHRNNPADSEYMTRKKTNTEDFYPNPNVSPVKRF
jgi:hypothetical protein